MSELCYPHNPNCHCPTNKRHTTYHEDEQTRNHPTVGGATRNESIAEPNQKPEPTWAPTNEEWDSALNGKNPRHAIPAVPGRSGSSEVFRGKRFALLKASYGLVSKEELETASRWNEDFEIATMANKMRPHESVPVTAKSLEQFPEFRKDVDLWCPQCGIVQPGQVCECPVGKKTWNGATPK